MRKHKQEGLNSVDAHLLESSAHDLGLSEGAHGPVLSSDVNYLRIRPQANPGHQLLCEWKRHFTSSPTYTNVIYYYSKIKAREPTCTL